MFMFMFMHVYACLCLCTFTGVHEESNLPVLKELQIFEKYKVSLSLYLGSSHETRAGLKCRPETATSLAWLGENIKCGIDIQP